MDYNDEIKYRKAIMLQVRNGGKISKEDRLWLSTHCIFNQCLGYPYLNTDIVHLETKKEYCIHVKMENNGYSGRILPVITVPAGKGKIVTNTLLVNYNGERCEKTVIKMLGVLLDKNHVEAEFKYYSSIGVMGVSYECDFYDDKQKKIVRKDSCTGDARYAMLRENIADNKIIYRCKSPISENFDSFIFSVEWND